MTELFWAPHFPTPDLKGTGFSSRRLGSRADYGRSTQGQQGNIWSEAAIC